MLTARDERTVIIKSSPELHESFKVFVSEHPQALLLALDALTAWSLDESDFSFQFLDSSSKTEGHFKMHEELESYYDHFSSEKSLVSSAPTLKLLKNHLCWEIQNEFSLLKNIAAWVNQNCITHIIFERIEVSEQRRFAPNINDLAQGWFKQKGVRFEFLPKT